MIKYAVHEWTPDAPYVILLNQYKEKDECDNQWVKKFSGKRLCVIDGGDKDRYWEPFISSADIYIKDNSYRKTDSSKVRIGCYCPSMKVPFLMDGVEWRNSRKLDWMFTGDVHKGRQKKVRKWERDVGGKYKVGDEHAYPRKKYLRMLSKTKMVPSFKGYGDRCRREWEALLCGGMLVNDPSLIDYPFVIMQPGEHFSFIPKCDVSIARAGYDLARKCWMQSPSIDIRMAALYTFFDAPQMWTYEQVEEEERKYGLR